MSKLNVKIFADGADFEGMLQAAKNPLIQGLTTNPTLMRKAGITDYEEFSKKVLSHIKILPISLEVFADDHNEMRRQALKIGSWGANVYVKIPVTNCEGTPSYELIRELTQNGIKLNVTALLTLEQVSYVTQALKGGAPSIVSIFAGRIADTGKDPLPMMRAALAMCQAAGPQIELLWASPREFLNIMQADEMGCHIITVTADILSKISLLNKDLNLFSLETVRMFKNDAEKAGYRL